MFNFLRKITRSREEGKKMFEFFDKWNQQGSVDESNEPGKRMVYLNTMDLNEVTCMYVCERVGPKGPKTRATTSR